ncbi:hypothetical protein AJ80_06041 [Polytolypa hystricis UAMH7299]|uniref:Uncharacterized protein n=1 Tax=Polytolypa hystricis (strain UAMH7299) TaxID=1447883 RepID=A0A2B7XZX5_POLH7|nr:hypothetical protein AJ80_06041 [Polytolypa hystricis UAMH7299]
MAAPGIKKFISFESQRHSGPKLLNNNDLPSPTLTNPDLILPYEGERESSTPSPPFRPLQLPSPTHISYLSNNALDNGGGVGHAVVVTNMNPADIGVAVSLSLPEKGKLVSSSSGGLRSNNWMYGGHEAGPPLSDIGEEDAMSQYTSWSNHDRSNDDDGSGCSTPDASAIPARQLKERDVVEDCDAESCSSSSSTISAHSERLEDWQELERSRSSQLGQETENENGLNDGFLSENASHDVDSQGTDNGNMEAIVEEDEGDVHDDVGKEAERILERAKRRLTHMEGNLNRARSSVRMTPSPSPVIASFPLSAYHHAAGGLQRSFSKTERRAQTSLAGALLRQRASQDSNLNSSHSRGLSDVYASPSQNNITNREQRVPFRSFSALGSTNAYSYGPSGISPNQENFKNSSSYRASLSLLNYNRADILKATATTTSVSQPHSPVKLESSSTASSSRNGSSESTGAHNSNTKIITTEDANPAYASGPPSRAQSQLAVRGLQDQMEGLKTKISTLKVKAQEESLRRRSLQSLRTPSPFTAAEQWYTSAGEYRGEDQNKEAYPVASWVAQSGEKNISENSIEARPVLQVQNPSPAHQSQQQNVERVLVDDEESVIAPSHYEDADEELSAEDDGKYSPESDIDRAALAEILNEPLDDSPESSETDLLEEFPPVPTMPEATRHEDREDAFDYEHFFLHSALGNYSQPGYRRQSYSSVSSVETTRPVSQSATYRSPNTGKTHVRTNSADSVSTTATFATATEGLDNSDDDYDESYVAEEIDNALFWNANKITDNHYGNNHVSRNGSTKTTRHSRSSHTSGATNGYNSMISPVNQQDASPDSSTSTPRARSRSNSYTNNTSTQIHRQSGFPLPPQRTLHPTTAAAATHSPSSLISTLISSAAAQYANSPGPGGADGTSPATPRLSKQDSLLLETVFHSLGKVALQLQLSSSADKRSSIDERSTLLFRRRLDAARRVLDGQLDI